MRSNNNNSNSSTNLDTFIIKLPENTRQMLPDEDTAAGTPFPATPAAAAAAPPAAAASATAPLTMSRAAGARTFPSPLLRACTCFKSRTLASIVSLQSNGIRLGQRVHILRHLQHGSASMEPLQGAAWQAGALQLQGASKGMRSGCDQGIPAALRRASTHAFQLQLRQHEASRQAALTTAAPAEGSRRALQ